MGEITNKEILDRLNVKSRMFCTGVKPSEILQEDIEAVIAIANKIYNVGDEENEIKLEHN